MYIVPDNDTKSCAYHILATFSTIEVLRKTVDNRGVVGYVKASTTIARLLYDSWAGAVVQR